MAEGIREAAITSCIGSLKQLKLRNLCDRDQEDNPIFERNVLDENLELVSAEGYIQPLPEGGLRVHIHVAAARPSGEMKGGHCEDASDLHRRVHVPARVGRSERLTPSAAIRTTFRMI